MESDFELPPEEKSKDKKQQKLRRLIDISFGSSEDSVDKYYDKSDKYSPMIKMPKSTKS